MGELSKNKIAQSLLSFTILTIAIVFIPKLFSQKEATEIDGELVQASSAWNMQAPLILDDGIQIENHVALLGKNIQGTVTFSSLQKSEIDKDMLKKLEAQLIHNIKTASLMDTFRKKKVTITYFCKDIYGVHICDIKLTPNMYN